jgi:hypothetical protein
MSSLASQAHAAAATTLTPSVIAFYATVATIVPVLFIALAVQGTAYQHMLRTAITAAQDYVSGEAPWGRAQRSVPALLQLTGIVILIAGFAGELFAVLALYDGSDNSANRLIVLVATIILLLAVAAVPLGALLRLATILTAIIRAPLTLVVGPDGPPSDEPGKTNSAEDRGSESL